MASLKVQENLLFQEGKRMQKVCTYHYPTTVQGRLATYQILRSSYQHSKVQAKKNKRKNYVNC